MAEHLLCCFVVFDYLHYNTGGFFRCYEIVNDKVKKTLKSRLSGGFFYFGLGAVITSVSR